MMDSNSILISEHEGKLVSNYKNTYKNRYKIWEDEKGEYIEMFSKNGSFYFDHADLDDVLKYTWNLQPNKTSKKLAYYARTNINKTTVQLHQFIIYRYENRHNQLTVDHIDKNSLNNRRYNLRLADFSTQRRNTNKSARRKDSASLPPGIEELPKYVGYTKHYNKQRKREEEYFFIKRHPSGKRFQSTVSPKVSVQEKLHKTLEKLKELNKCNTFKLRERPKVLTTTPPGN